jgi:hypothetical protein
MPLPLYHLPIYKVGVHKTRAPGGRNDNILYGGA